MNAPTTTLNNGRIMVMARVNLTDNGIVRCPYCATKYPSHILDAHNNSTRYVQALLAGAAPHICVGCGGHWLPTLWIDTVEVFCPECGVPIQGRRWGRHVEHHEYQHAVDATVNEIDDLLRNNKETP